MSAAVASESAADFNNRVIAEFRADRGHVGGALADTRLLLLHHVGAVTGLERIVPLAYLDQPDGSLLVTASNGGAAEHPDWYHNVKAHPLVTIEVGEDRYCAAARELDAGERAAQWPTLVDRAPSVRRFQAMTGRIIPVFILSRQPRGSGVR